MFQTIRKFWNRGDAAPAPGAARLPDGHRAYAVGDIHGRRDLFEALIEAIEHDDASAGAAETSVVLLGDLVDRGPDSAGVVARAREWQVARKVAILAGNHEEMFLRSFEDKDTFRHFLRHGGRETILSYGVDRRKYEAAALEEAQQLMREVVPQQDLDFIESFQDFHAIGDYLFVHAGIEPGVPLEEQKQSSLRWIREPFLSHSASHGQVVVHGHTIRDDPEDRGNRIGIDTGAYMSGRLTALVLEGDRRRYIETVHEDGLIRTRHSPAR